ncbi:MAG: DinB family protein [Candidatus Rokubacteria bacterium]|nr:DinB family protein [Candidatus Rokubacteria bacterium]
MTLELIRRLYDYHRWANHRLFDEAEKRGEGAVERDMGTQWSFPSVRRMFAHIYGADTIWLARWKGTSMTAIPGQDIPSMSALRARWDALEGEQRAFVDGLRAPDLERIVQYRNTEGKEFRTMLAPLLQHVPNHATHHRSEIATMLTIISGSPPDTGLATYLWTTGKAS